MRFATQVPPAQAAMARELEQAVVITDHALMQMAVRGILKPTVLAVVAQGQWAPNDENELVHLDEWCLIMEENKVITAFERERWRA